MYADFPREENRHTSRAKKTSFYSSGTLGLLIIFYLFEYAGCRCLTKVFCL